MKMIINIIIVIILLILVFNTYNSYKQNKDLNNKINEIKIKCDSLENINDELKQKAFLMDKTILASRKLLIQLINSDKESINKNLNLIKGKYNTSTAKELKNKIDNEFSKSIDNTDNVIDK